MTIPMMQGWWDESGKALQGLAQTVARTVDPQFDNKQALAEFMRQNPANQQQMIDMANLNPGIVKGMFGDQVTQQLISMGQPSASASIEAESRRLMNTPADQLPNTFVAQAAAAQQRVKTPLDIEEQRTNIEARKLSTEALGFNLSQEQAKALREQPGIDARYAGLQEALAAFPNAATADAQSLASRYFNRSRATDAEREKLTQEMNAAFTANPNTERAFYASLAFLGNELTQERADARADARAQTSNASLAFQIAKLTGVTQAQALNYINGAEEDGVVTRAIANSLEADRIATAARQMATIQGQVTKIDSASSDEERATLISGINTELAALIPGLNVQLETYNPKRLGDIIGTVASDLPEATGRYVVNYNGIQKVLTDVELSNLVINPESRRTLIGGMVIGTLDLATARNNLQQLEAQKAAGTVAESIYTTVKAQLENRIKSLGGQ